MNRSQRCTVSTELRQSQKISRNSFKKQSIILYEGRYGLKFGQSGRDSNPRPLEHETVISGAQPRRSVVKIVVHAVSVRSRRFHVLFKEAVTVATPVRKHQLNFQTALTMIRKGPSFDLEDMSL